MGGSGGDEQFCLKWNDFHESLVTTLGDIRSEEDFVDVTLVCGAEHIRAHRLVLSACSDFFRSLFKRATTGPAWTNPAANPMVVLCDITPSDLRHILHFMYNGEVEVKQANLNTFLAVAERLRVRGLCQSGGKTSPSPPSAPPGQTRSPPPHEVDRRRSASPSPQTSSSKQISTGQRRCSLDHVSGPVKRPKLEAVDPSSPSDGHGQEASDGMARASAAVAAGHHDDLSRSGGADSEPEYAAEYGYGGGAAAAAAAAVANAVGGGSGDDGPPGAFGTPDAGAMAGALMGMAGMSPRGMLDPAAAKEFWRRAAMARMSLGSTSNSSASSPPSSAYLQHTRDQQQPHEPQRRQRSVYTSDQIAQLEAFFNVNEYIDGERKKQLSRLTNIPEQQIKVWFQNRRQKKKREVEEMQQQALQQERIQQEERMRAVVSAAGGPVVERSGGGSGLFPDGAAEVIKEDNDGDNEDGGGDDE